MVHGVTGAVGTATSTTTRTPESERLVEHDSRNSTDTTADSVRGAEPAPVTSSFISGIFRHCWPAPFKTLRQTSPLLVVNSSGVMEASSSAPSEPRAVHTSPRRPPVARGASEPIGSTTGGRSQRPRIEGRHQGVLWKRRDFFKNRWRPRWFVLQPGQGILTYYLFSLDQTNVPETIVSSSSSEPQLNPESPSTRVSSSAASPSPFAAEPSLSSSSNHQYSRDRTTSWDSRASENTLDYDVVPRGTIYLLGCTVHANPDLTRPGDQLFCFTIDPPTTTEPQIHLAARTPELRDLWMDKIAAVCNNSSDSTSANQRGAAVTQTLTPTRPNIQTIPEYPSVDSDSHSSSLVPAISARRSVSEGNLQRPLVGRSSPSVEVTSAEGDDPVEWKSQSELRSKFLYSNLTEAMVLRLKGVMQQGLHTLMKNDNDSDWKVLYRQPNAVALRLRGRREQHSHTIKIDAMFPYPIKRVFELLVDGSRLEDVEGRKAVKESRVVHQLNPHTSIDWVSYHGEWPSRCISFAVLSHWQLLEREGEQAIVIVSVSCQEATGEVRRSRASALRSGIQGEISMCCTMLRRAVLTGDNRIGKEACRMNRILSVNLGQGAPTQLINSFLNQRASLPVELPSYVDHFEPNSESRHKSNGPLTDEQLIRDIVRRLEDTRKRAIERRKKSAADPRRQDSSFIITDDSFDNGGDDGDENFLLPPLDQQTMLLLVPLVVYGMSLWTSASPSPFFWFVLSIYCSLRWIVLLHLGPVVSQPSAALLGSVTCRFRVELKGIQRFISNKKEEREEMKRGKAEVGITHIVACAVASAMKKEQALSAKRVSFPLLFIDRIVRCESKPVSVTFLSDSGNGLKATTLHRVDHSVQRVADDMSSENASVAPQDVKIGSCLIIEAPKFEEVEMESDVLPSHPNVRVVCTIGGVHVSRDTPERTGALGRPSSPISFLSLSLTVMNTYSFDFAASRRLAEDVQTMLRFPEMCDD